MRMNKKKKKANKRRGGCLLEKASEGLTHLLAHLFPAFHILSSQMLALPISSHRAAMLIFSNAQLTHTPPSPASTLQQLPGPLPQCEVQPPKLSRS